MIKKFSSRTPKGRGFGLAFFSYFLHPIDCPYALCLYYAERFFSFSHPRQGFALHNLVAGYLPWPPLPLANLMSEEKTIPQRE